MNVLKTKEKNIVYHMLILTPSLPQDVQFPGWKVLTHSCQQNIF